MKTLPPATKTAGSLRRLRPAPLLLVACLAASVPAWGRPAPLKVLLGAPVADTAAQSMTPALWMKLVIARIEAEVVPFAGGIPTLADCRGAHADYMVAAPFELRPRLPGMPNASGRTAARTHIVVTNCITDNVVTDQVINLESDPPSGDTEGDIESVPEIQWTKSATATLARYALAFPRSARVVHVTPPFALVDVGGLGISEGEALRIFANANKEKKGPIPLTVTQSLGRYLQVVYSTLPGAPAPAAGDLVEPVPKPTPTASATPAPANPTPAPSPSHQAGK